MVNSREPGGEPSRKSLKRVRPAAGQFVDKEAVIRAALNDLMTIDPGYREVAILGQASKRLRRLWANAAGASVEKPPTR